eukprot:gb/GECG01013834.1/.p1 GENE.gb/GECG01013834.1/~~gb/GECG01013834.1/.p1  ORF type:complete len:123 (+),score=1.43 gb/GECG01013834.1/:1-369(+)
MIPLSFLYVYRPAGQPFLTRRQPRRLDRGFVPNGQDLQSPKLYMKVFPVQNRGHCSSAGFTGLLLLLVFILLIAGCCEHKLQLLEPGIENLWAAQCLHVDPDLSLYCPSGHLKQPRALFADE